MIIISYNLSWATQEDKVAGTEANFVKECKKYGNKKNDQLSFCTQNALDLLVKFINNKPNEKFIICIQEGTEKETPRFIQELNNNLNNRFSYKATKKYGSAYLYTIYDKSINFINQQGGELTTNETGRPYQILQFENFTIINAHFPHNLSLNQYKEIFNKLAEKVTKYPLYFAGDFNDHNDRLLNSNDIKFGNYTLNFINKNINKTCCWPNFGLHSDYILSTIKKGTFGVLATRINNNKNNQNTKNKKILSSDHKPVYLQIGSGNNIKPTQSNIINKKSGLYQENYYYYDIPIPYNPNHQILLSEDYVLSYEQENKQRELKYKTYKPIGLPNVGNTCHINAWIQLLYRCDFYRLGILNDFNNLYITKVNEPNVSLYFNELFEKMNKNEKINMNNFISKCPGKNNLKKISDLDVFFNNSILKTLNDNLFLKQLFQIYSNNSNTNNINRYIYNVLLTTNKTIETIKNNIKFSRYAILKVGTTGTNKLTNIKHNIKLTSSLYNKEIEYKLLAIIVNINNKHFTCLVRNDENTFYLLDDDKQIVKNKTEIDIYMQIKGNTAEILCYEMNE